MESIAILEKDDNGDVLVAWRYPNVDVLDEKVLIARSGLRKDTVKQQFSFSKFKSRWFYVWTILTSERPRLEAFAICIVTSEYFPEKYGSLGRLFGKIYSKPAGTPVHVLQGYLSVLTRGSWAPGGDLPPFDEKDFNIKACYLAGSITGKEKFIHFMCVRRLPLILCTRGI